MDPCDNITAPIACSTPKPEPPSSEEEKAMDTAAADAAAARMLQELHQRQEEQRRQEEEQEMLELVARHPPMKKAPEKDPEVVNLCEEEPKGRVRVRPIDSMVEQKQQEEGEVEEEQPAEARKFKESSARTNRRGLAKMVHPPSFALPPISGRNNPRGKRIYRGFGNRDEFQRRSHDDREGGGRNRRRRRSRSLERRDGNNDETQPFHGKKSRVRASANDGNKTAEIEGTGSQPAPPLTPNRQQQQQQAPQPLMGTPLRSPSKFNKDKNGHPQPHAPSHHQQPGSSSTSNRQQPQAPPHVGIQIALPTNFREVHGHQQSTHGCRNIFRYDNYRAWSLASDFNW